MKKKIKITNLQLEAIIKENTGLNKLNEDMNWTGPIELTIQNFNRVTAGEINGNARELIQNYLFKKKYKLALYKNPRNLPYFIFLTPKGEEFGFSSNGYELTPNEIETIKSQTNGSNQNLPKPGDYKYNTEAPIKSKS